MLWPAASAPAGCGCCAAVVAPTEVLDGFMSPATGFASAVGPAPGGVGGAVVAYQCVHCLLLLTGRPHAGLPAGSRHAACGKACMRLMTPKDRQAHRCWEMHAHRTLIDESRPAGELPPETPLREAEAGLLATKRAALAANRCSIFEDACMRLVHSKARPTTIRDYTSRNLVGSFGRAVCRPAKGGLDHDPASHSPGSVSTLLADASAPSEVSISLRVSLLGSVH